MLCKSIVKDIIIHFYSTFVFICVIMYLKLKQIERIDYAYQR